MFKQNLFKGVVIFYVIVLSLVVGMIIHKFSATPQLMASPAVSFNLDVSEKMSPDKLVNQIYTWMDLDSQRSKSILSEGIPRMGDQEMSGGILDFVAEPKNLLDYFIYWTVGVDFGKPATYLASSLPQLDPAPLQMVSGSVSQASGEVITASAVNRGRQILKADNGNIVLNIGKDEMIKNGQQAKTEREDPPARQPEQGSAQVREAPQSQSNVAGSAPAPQKSPTNQKNSRKPRVLIYHTHGSETYFDDPHPKDSMLHTYLPNRGRVMMAGEELAKGLRAKGIDVYHDTSSYDGENFSRSYANARKGVQTILQKQSFDLVIDLHRDGSANLQSEKLTNHYKHQINGKTAAQVMMVLAKGQMSYSSRRHNWKTNAQVCTAIAGQLQSKYPGLLRKIDSRDTVRFNQDLHPHAILLELGYEGNTTAEALYTAQLLADVIGELLREQPVFLLD